MKTVTTSGLKILLSFLCALQITTAAFCVDRRQFRVGMIFPMTGIPADYGDAMHKGMELAVSDRPDLFSEMKFIYEDAGYDPKMAVQVFKKLHEVDKVDLIYIWGVTFCKAVAPVAQQFSVPVVAQCIDKESARDRPYVIRFMNYTDQYATVLLEYLRKKNYRSYGVVLGDNAYAEELFNSFRAQLKSDEKVTVIERYTSGQYEMRSTLSRIRTSSYDAIGVFLGLSQVAQFYKQRQEQGLTFPTFGTNFFESTNEIKASGYSMDGAVYSSNKVREEFLAHFTKRYGKPTQLAYSSLSYEFALLAGELFNGRGGMDPDDILRALESVGRREGTATGPYVFKNQPDVGRFFDFELTMKAVNGESIRQL